jgi:hypothetical protein
MLGHVYGHTPGAALTQNIVDCGLTQAFDNYLQDLA